MIKYKRSEMPIIKTLSISGINYTILLLLFISLFSCFSEIYSKSLKNKFQSLKKNKIRNQNFNAIRSYIDHKSYYIYTLPNSLQVMIVSDKYSRSSAAAITVNSGTIKEGKINGLAHFTEHMLFLGSKKYPKATEFVDFITQKNGIFNGYTDFDTTAFYFRIHPNHFYKGLDIFSRFFIDPLFDPQYVMKEINSVNSEFERNLQLDRKRKEQVFRQISAEGSYFNKFSTGNNLSLKIFCQAHNINLRDEVIRYYNSHFRADNMKLIIYGHESINYYKSLVEKTFYQMNSPQTPYVWINSAKTPFKLFEEGRLTLYKTLNNHQNFEIMILLPDLFRTLPHNVGLYFKVILNYKGKGSLRDALIKRGLGSHLRATLRKTYDGWSVFKVGCFLTRKGVKQLNRVISIIFKYFQYMRNISLNPKLYNFVKRYYDVRFLLMRRRISPFAFVRNMCMAFLKYPQRLLFTQHKILYMYNSNAIIDYGKYFVINNSIIMLGDRHFDPKLLYNYNSFVTNFNTNTLLNNREPWYNVPFSSYRFSPIFMDSLNKDNSNPENLGFTKDFIFLKGYRLPKSIHLVRQCPRSLIRECLKRYRNDRFDLTPTILEKTNMHEISFKQDRSYLISKLNFFNKFIFPESVINPKYQALFRLFVVGFAHHFKNFFYSQKIKHNSIRVKLKANSFEIKIYSFSHNLKSLAKEFFFLLKNVNISKNIFLVVRDELRKTALSKINLIPHLKGFINFFSLMMKDYVSNSSLLKSLESVKYEEFYNFSKSIFNRMFIKSFIHGNSNKEDALILFKESIIENFHNYSPISRQDKHYKNFQANIKGYYIFREKILNKINVNHAILNFYQLGEKNLRNIILSYLIKFLCGNIYFTQLRIKEQLGYITKGKIVAIDNLIYYLILVQGSKMTPDKMDFRIENVIELMRKRLHSVTLMKFNIFKRIIWRRIRFKDRNLNSRSNRLWREIISKRRYYNIIPISRAILQNLTLPELLTFFDEKIYRKLSKLSIQEFSSKIEIIPRFVGSVRGVKGVLIEDRNYFRRKNQYINI